MIGEPAIVWKQEASNLADAAPDTQSPFVREMFIWDNLAEIRIVPIIEMGETSLALCGNRRWDSD